jgi:hypothetical protein
MTAAWARSRHVPKFGLRVISPDASDPLRWDHVMAEALSAHGVGFDPVIASGDNLVFGEPLEAFGEAACLSGRIPIA